MKNRKSKLVRIVAFLMFTSIFTGCSLIEPPRKYCQFTPDELGYLYFDKDSLVYDGSYIYIYDTISFFFNSTDTLRCRVYTHIYAWEEPFDLIEIAIFGESGISFDEKTGFRFAKVRLSKELKNDAAVKMIDFSMQIGGCSDVILNQPLDTAFVLGKEYENVYKVTYPDDSPNKLKYIYFDKKFGFIKIETSDGRKLERLDI